MIACFNAILSDKRSEILQGATNFKPKFFIPDFVLELFSKACETKSGMGMRLEAITRVIWEWDCVACSVRELSGYEMNLEWRYIHKYQCSTFFLLPVKKLSATVTWRYIDIMWQTTHKKQQQHKPFQRKWTTVTVTQLVHYSCNFNPSQRYQAIYY